jgi:hypothetical protein
MCYRLVALGDAVTETDMPWVFASGYAHTKPLVFRLRDDGLPPATYTVRLYFAEPEEEFGPGERVFSVLLQGQRVLEDLDIVRATGRPRHALVREVRRVNVDRDLRIELMPSAASPVKTPILCGFRALRE